MNTGLKQATVAYKVTPDGQPVDVDGQLTSISGKKQAIALLEGRTNPNPSLYQVEFYFGEKEIVKGEPSTTVDLTYCPVSVFRIDTTYLVLHPGNPDDIINVFSTFGWELVAAEPFATVTPNTGGAENTAVTVARTSTLGQGYISFKDTFSNEVIKVYVVNTDALGWVLETGFWNNLRFWEATGVWNY